MWMAVSCPEFDFVPLAGASLLAMVVNDTAGNLTPRGFLRFFASKLAPTPKFALKEYFFHILQLKNIYSINSPPGNNNPKGSRLCANSVSVSSAQASWAAPMPWRFAMSVQCSNSP
ncbi:hypothetical protein BZ163_11610 [Pseudomonas sp. VI4.1]|nr:hypothetical protein BZ163_11610 [Pseudomonas sp. VI4.1]